MISHYGKRASNQILREPRNAILDCKGFLVEFRVTSFSFREGPGSETYGSLGLPVLFL